MLFLVDGKNKVSGKRKSRINREHVIFFTVYDVSNPDCMKKRREIQQENFKNEYQRLHVNLLFTASWLNLQSTKLLKPHNISPQQFNILRILYEIHPEPATVKLLTDQMVDHMSNASRLVEKLKQKGLVEREPSDEDRRRVNVHITDKGLSLLEEILLPIENNIQENLSGLRVSEAAQLNQLLNQIRG